MARNASIEKLGFYPILQEHWQSIAQLVKPINNAESLLFLDPVAGEGDFLQYLTSRYRAIGYANEIDEPRAKACVAKFGANAVTGDIYNLVTNKHSFSLIWLNPPYGVNEDGRMEFEMLKHSYEWLAVGGVMMWCVYTHHITNAVIKWWAENFTNSQLVHLPGKHLGEYSQIVLVGNQMTHWLQDYNQRREYEENVGKIKYQLGHPTKNQITDIIASPYFRPLTIPDSTSRPLFTQVKLNNDEVNHGLKTQGIHHSLFYQRIISPQTMDVPKLKTIVPLKPEHLTLALLSFATESDVRLQSELYGDILLRTTTRLITVVNETEDDEGNKQIVETIKPVTKLSWMRSDGQYAILSTDKQIGEFVMAHFDQLYDYIVAKTMPIYNQFDFNGEIELLDKYTINGAQLFTPQAHAVSALLKSLKTMRRVLYVGEQGVGKTFTTSVVMDMHWRKLSLLKRQEKFMMVVCPSHLRDQWQNELRQTMGGNALIQVVDTADERAFQIAKRHIEARNPNGYPKVLVVNTNATKLGSPIQVVCNSKTRIKKDSRGKKMRVKIHTCPNCATHLSTNMVDELYNDKIANCPHCHSPLWQISDNAVPLHHLSPTRIRYTKDGHLDMSPTTRAARIELSEYIKKKHPHHLEIMIWDEVQDGMNIESGNGIAVNRLANIARYSILATGTPLNAKSSSAFNYAHILIPFIRETYDWGDAPRLEPKKRGAKTRIGVCAEQEVSVDQDRTKLMARQEFVATYGVLEEITTFKQKRAKKWGVYTHVEYQNKRVREGVGVSAHLVSLMLPHSIFFEIDYLRDDIPPMKHIEAQVEMPRNMREFLECQKAILTGIDINNIAQALADAGVDCPDVPTLTPAIEWWMRSVDDLTKDYLIAYKNVPIYTVPAFWDANTLTPKEQELYDIIQHELALDEGNVVVIGMVTTDTRDMRQRVATVLKEFSPYILNGDPKTRIKTVRKAVANGARVIITNHEKVKIGMNLLWKDLGKQVSAMINYQMTYNAYTLAQFNTRHRRANSWQDECRVYYLYYTDWIDEHAYKIQREKMKQISFFLGKSEGQLIAVNALADGDGGDIRQQIRLAMQKKLAPKDTTFYTPNQKIIAMNRAMWMQNHALRNTTKPSEPPPVYKIYPVIPDLPIQTCQTSIFDFLTVSNS